MNNGVGGMNNLSRDLVNVFQQGGYATTGQMHALQQQRFLQQQQLQHQQQIPAGSQLNVSDPGSASNPHLDAQTANPLDNFGGSSGGLSYGLDPANAAKQIAALQAASRSRALSNSASGTPVSQFPTPINPTVQPGGATATPTTATPGINPPSNMDPQMQNMQNRQIQNAQAMILNAMLNNRPQNFLPQLADTMEKKGTPLPQAITGVPSPNYDPSTSPIRNIQPGSSPGTIQFAGKELDLHMLMIWVIQRGGFQKIQFDDSAWESFLNHIGLPRRQPSTNPSQPPVDLVQILQRHYFILLFSFEPIWTGIVKQKVMLTMRQQQHAALQQAMAASGGQGLNPAQMAMMNSNLQLGNAANPQMGMQTPNPAALQQPAFAQQQNLLAQQQAKTQAQQQQMAQQLLAQQQAGNILGQQPFAGPNGTHAVAQQQGITAGMPQPPVSDPMAIAAAGLDQNPTGAQVNALDAAVTPGADTQMGDSDSERKRKRTDTGDVDGKRPRLDEQPLVADGTVNGMVDPTASNTLSHSPTRTGPPNGVAQSSQPTSGPRMKIQYRPLFRQLNTYGGRNMMALERDRTTAHARRPVRPIDEWGEVDIDGLIMSIRSRVAVEVTYSLTALLALSTAGRRQEEGFILTPCADDLIPVLLDFLKETAFGREDADEPSQPVTSSSTSPSKLWTHQDLIKLALDDGSEIFGPGFAFVSAAGQKRRDGRRCADPERGPKDRPADTTLITIQLFRNLSVFPANAEIFMRYPVITDLVVRMCGLEDESASASFPEPLVPVFTLTDLVKMQDHALHYLANMSQWLNFEDLRPQTPPRIFRLAARYVLSPSVAVSPYQAAVPPSTPQQPPLPPAAPDLALDMFSRVLHRDEHRQLISQVVPSQEILNLYSALVRMLPVGREDYTVMTLNQHSLEAWVGYAERIMLSIYSLVFLAPPSLKRKMKHPGVTSVITRLSYFYMKCVTPDGKSFAHPPPGPNTSHPFMVISRRAVETLKLLDQEGDCFVDDSSAMMGGPMGFPTFGIGYGEPDAMGTKAREEGVGILAGNWEQVVMRMMQCVGVDDEFFAEMDSLVRMGNAYEVRLPVGAQA